MKAEDTLRHDERTECVPLRQEVELLRRELEILSSINAKIGTGMDYLTVVDEIVATLREKVPFDGCNMGYIDDQGYLRIHKVRASQISRRSKATREFLSRIYRQRLDYRVGNEWVSRVVRDKIEIHCPEVRLEDFSEDERYLIENYGITGFYYLPIRIEDRVLGVLRFHNYGRPMHLSELEKDLIRTRAGIIARAMENARVYADLRRKSEIIAIDLAMAGRIQKTLLPAEPPVIDGAAIAFSYIPMLEVGGDYFDFLAPRGRRGFGVLVTDASGHGVPAAFITSMVKMAVQSERVAALADRPAMLMEQINRELWGKLADNFVTGWYCWFDLEAMRMRGACCGHPSLIRIRGGRAESRRSRGLVLGYFEGLSITELELDLAGGDRFVLCTDGLTEAMDRDRVFFGDALEARCEEHAGLDAPAFSEALLRDLRAHTLYHDRRAFDDDVALVVVDVT